MLLELNIERSLRTTTKRRKMIYFGHDIRHMNSSTMKEIVQGVTGKRRGRGRPKKLLCSKHYHRASEERISSTEHPRSEKMARDREESPSVMMMSKDKDKLFEIQPINIRA